MVSQKVIKTVTPAYPPRRTGAGVHKCSFSLDSGFRRNDGKAHFPIFCETVKVDQKLEQGKKKWK
jgi:hypothetical protein